MTDFLWNINFRSRIGAKLCIIRGPFFQVHSLGLELQNGPGFRERSFRVTGSKLENSDNSQPVKTTLTQNTFIGWTGDVEDDNGIEILKDITNLKKIRPTKFKSKILFRPVYAFPVLTGKKLFFFGFLSSKYIFS